MIHNKQIVVLAGGLGTRLGHLGRQHPKALIPVYGRVFLDYLLAPALRQGYRRFHFCLGHLSEQILNYLETLPKCFEITFTIDEMPRGTGGSLRSATGTLDGEFLLILGDTYLDAPYPTVVSHLNSETDAAMLVTSADCGVTPNVAISGGRVSQYEKSGMAAACFTDTGVASFKSAALEVVAEATEPFGLELVFRRLIAQHRLGAVEMDALFYDIGTPHQFGKFLKAVEVGSVLPESALTTYGRSR